MSDVGGPDWETASGPRPTTFESPVPNTNRGGRVGAETGANLAGESPCAGPISGLHRPLHTQFGCHERRRLVLQERGKLLEVNGHIAQLESQAAPERDVIVDGLSQRLHRLPPGHGSAMERS